LQPRYAGIDNPWRRLPWVLFFALMMWGMLLWGFGTLLGQISRLSLSSEPITAQILEVAPPIKHAPAPKPARPKPITKPVPFSPQKVQQPPKQLLAPIQPPVKAPPITKPIEQAPAPSTPVSLPKTDATSANRPSPYAISDFKYSKTPQGITPGAESNKISRGIPVPIVPPQFGAAYLSNPKPVYPPLAKKIGMEGKVMLKVLVSREGNVLDIEIAESSGYQILDKAAAEAVKKWRFVPARQGDSPLDAWVQVPMVFNLKK